MTVAYASTSVNPRPFTLSRPAHQFRLSLADAPPPPKSLTDRYRPGTLAEMVGQGPTVFRLEAFLEAPYSTAFLFEGPSGVGKTTAALAIAAELGAVEFGGLDTIKSGQQDAEAVEKALDNLRFTPMLGSGWKVVIVDEADYMSVKASQVWLSALEDLPPRSVIIFTTNRADKFQDRFLDRCERFAFSADAAAHGLDVQALVNDVWAKELGRTDAPDAGSLAGIVDDNGLISYRRVIRALEPWIAEARRNPEPVALEWEDIPAECDKRRAAEEAEEKARKKAASLAKRRATLAAKAERKATMDRCQAEHEACIAAKKLAQSQAPRNTPQRLEKAARLRAWLNARRERLAGSVRGERHIGRFLPTASPDPVFEAPVPIPAAQFIEEFPAKADAESLVSQMAAMEGIIGGRVLEPRDGGGYRAQIFAHPALADQDGARSVILLPGQWSALGITLPPISGGSPVATLAPPHPLPDFRAPAPVHPGLVLAMAELTESPSDPEPTPDATFGSDDMESFGTITYEGQMHELRGLPYYDDNGDCIAPLADGRTIRFTNSKVVTAGFTSDTDPGIDLRLMLDVENGPRMPQDATTTAKVESTTPPGNPLLQAILDAPLPPVVNPAIRRESRKVKAAEIRKVLKSMGIKGISVTAPNYSMASSVHIKIPRASDHDRGAVGHEFHTCPLCMQHTRAERKIAEIILAAFPDLDDRSDSQSDYHDNPLSIS